MIRLRWFDLMSNVLTIYNPSYSSLTVDAGVRPTPREMLKHPWIIEQQSIKVPMDKWIAQVWGWEIPSSSSSSSHRDGKERERRRRERSERKKAGMGAFAGTPGNLGGGLEGSSGGSLLSPESPRPPF